MTDDDIKRDFVIKLARELFINSDVTNHSNREFLFSMANKCFDSADVFYTRQKEYCKKYESEDNAWENLE